MRDLLRLVSLYRKSLFWVLAGIVLSLVATLANIALMATSGWFIAAMGVAGAAGTSLNYFTPAAIIRACAIARTGGRYAERLVTHEATFRVLADLRRWFYDRLEPLAPAGLEAYRSGDLASRLQGDIDRLQGFYLRFLVPVVAGGLAGLAVIGFVARLDRTMALVLLGFLVVAAAALPALASLIGAAAGRRTVAASADLKREAVDLVEGLAELAAHGAGPAAVERLMAEHRRLVAARRRVSLADGVGEAGTRLAADFALAAMLGLGAPLVAAGHLAGPDYVMLALLALSAFETVAPFPAAFRGLAEVVASAKRLMSVGGRRTPTATRPRAATPAAFDLAVEGLAFAYRPDRPVIDDLSFTLAAGGRLVVTGASGAGKSTLVALLTGLRAPSGGTIRLGGMPCADIDGEALRAAFAVLPQDVRLFAGTLRDNLVLGHPQASAAEIEHWCRVALLDEVVAGLPEGLDTFVGETGRVLSGGQLKRLGLARALLKPAPIVILDEPTEGLDEAMAERLLACLDRELGTRSLVVVTHRDTASGVLAAYPRMML